MRQPRNVSPSVIESIVRDLSSRATSEGYPVFPSTKSSIKRHLVRGLDKGTLADETDVTLAAAALLAGGIAMAAQVPITPLVVKLGWQGEIGYERGCPPAICFKRSVLTRVDELKDRLPAFRMLLEP